MVLRCRNGKDHDLRKVCPKTLRIIINRDIDVKLRQDMVRSDSTLVGFGPNAIPWVEPLRELATCQTSATWTSTHQGLLRARASGGLFPPARIAEFPCNAGVVSPLCSLCGQLCDQHHRDITCPARHWQREQYGLPSCVMSAAKEHCGSALFQRCLVPDPTLLIPPPAERPMVWFGQWLSAQVLQVSLATPSEMGP